MSIGLVMFGKGLVVGLFAILAGMWDAYRKRRIERGLPLKRNRRGVYEVSDWTATVDRWAYRLWDWLIYATYAWWALLLGILAIWGKEGLRSFFIWLLF